MTITGEPIGAKQDFRHIPPFQSIFGFTVRSSSGVGQVFPTVPTMTPIVSQNALRSTIEYLQRLDWTKSMPTTLAPEPPGEAIKTPGQRIAKIRALTGLTTNQLGRLFGVSRRSIHNWLNGKPMAPHHEERAEDILSIIVNLTESNSADRRAALFDSSTGTSIFHQLVAGRQEDARLHVAGASPGERLGS